MQLLYENGGAILEQALWGLGNIAGDCANCRNMVIKKGGVECVIRIVKQADRQLIVELGAWVLTNLCGGNPKPHYEMIKSALPVLGDLIVRESVKQQVLHASLWSLANHTEGKKSKIRHLLTIEHIIPRLVELCYNQ
jgi:importin subunit alpha-6/7